MGWESVDPGRKRDRAVALRRRLHAPRRADRRAARGGLPRLPLRRRRRALRPAGHDRAGRAAVDRADDPRGRRRDRLPPDGERPGAPLRRVRRVRRRLGHLPRRGDGRSRPAWPRPRARTGSRWASRSTPAPSPSRPRPSPRSGRRRHGPLHEHRAGLLRAGVHAGGVRRGSRSSRRSSTIPIQVDGGVGEANAQAVRDAGATPARRRERGLRRPGSRRPRTARIARRRGMSLERALELADAAAAGRLSEPDRRRGASSPTARSSARA